MHTSKQLEEDTATVKKHRDWCTGNLMFNAMEIETERKIGKQRTMQTGAKDQEEILSTDQERNRMTGICSVEFVSSTSQLCSI